MERNNNTMVDYCLAAGVVVEAAVLYFLLTKQISAVGYFLPGLVVIVSTVITITSFHDFFRHINKK